MQYFGLRTKVHRNVDTDGRDEDTNLSMKRSLFFAVFFLVATGLIMNAYSSFALVVAANISGPKVVSSSIVRGLVATPASLFCESILIFGI